MVEEEDVERRSSLTLKWTSITVCHPASNHSVSFMATRHRQTANAALVSSDGFRFILSNVSVPCSFSSPFPSPPMGRRPWATPEQLVFLHSYTHQLAQAKAGSGLNVLYARVTQDFQISWTPEPYSPLKAPTATPSQLDELTKAQLYDV